MPRGKTLIVLGISKTIPDQTNVETDLKSGVRGEVHLEPVWRGIYATDASIYQIEPMAVVVPRDRADVLHALKVARQRGLKVLPRGGGTSLAGQTVGQAIVIDFSKYMNRILEVNHEERWLRVEPGRVRDELNSAISSTGLHFGPETATSNRANVGGMIANNSSGTRSIIYKKTVDHVLELTVLLASGEELHLKNLSPMQWNEIAKRDDREGRIYRSVKEIVQNNRSEIAARYPKVMRRVGGYNLDEFPEGEDWNLSKLIVGSEGTLAIVVEAKLNLVPLPKAKAMCVAHFRKMPEALRAVAPIVKHGPSMVELLDRSILDPARRHHETSKICDWIAGDPTAVLVIEFFGEEAADAQSKVDAVIQELQSTGFGYAHPRMFSAEEQAKVMNVRAAGQGLMMGAKGDAKSIDFIDDSAVPLEVLPDYIGEVMKLCQDMQVPVNAYAHASVGLIHVRPILNLKLADEIEKMKIIAEKTFDLVKKYGGSWSGEHGDGLVRSFMNQRYFGDKLYGAFKQIKQLFDPDNMMNPGKIVDAQGIDENLRMGVQYRALPFRTSYFYRDEGGFGQAVEMCTGLGACRKTGSGTMCPSYMATRDEIHSTRGRANALRLAMTGQLGFDGMTSDAVRGVLDLCLGCKGCKAECPSNVDMAKLKEEFLRGYHEKRGVSLGERFFSRAPAMARRASGRFAATANWMGKQKPVRALMERVLNLDRRRPLPQFARETFPDWFARQAPSQNALNAPPDRRVVLFNDTFMNYHEPELGKSAVSLLEGLGYRVILADAGCCGRPLISHGFLQEAKEQGTLTLKKINNYLLGDIPVVVCEPGCMSALTDDLPDLIDNVQLAKRIQAGVKMMDVFLKGELEAGRIDPKKFGALARGKNADGESGPRFLVHGHCHQKALYGTKAMKELLGLIPGASVNEIGSGCCGMAGSFGYEKNHYDLSLAVGEDRLFPAIRAMAPGTRLVACGFSCRHQIADGVGIKAQHFVQAMTDGGIY